MKKFKIILTLVFLINTLTLPAGATTLSEVLSGVADNTKPASLTSLGFLGDMKLDLNLEVGAFLPEQVSLIAAWRAPDDWFCTYELSGELATGISQYGSGHPAVDHVLLSRPDLIDILNIDWSVTYKGTAMWDGEPAWQLEYRPKDHLSDMPYFQAYVRKDDFVLLRTSVEFPDGSTGITDLAWIIVEDVLVPARFTTLFDPAVGPLNGYETNYFNHEINPDLSDFEFPQQEGVLLSNNDPDIDDGPPVFEELYHGFADDPIIADMLDSSGTYDRLKFTFSLYVEDRSVIGQLNDQMEAVRDLAIDIIADWDWSGDNGLSTPGGKYECGIEIMEAIGEFLGTEAITDFYFLDFEPLEEGED
jgi:hypothetical protein